MHLSTVALYLAAGLSVVKANFDIYYVESGMFIRDDFDMEGYQILRSDDEVDCKGDVNHPIWLGARGDVSSTLGIRCKDEGPYHGSCYAMGEPHTPEKIEVLEMNLGHYHWTIYKDRNYGLYDKTNYVMGVCEPATGEFKCKLGGEVTGKRLFRCYTHMTKDAIKDRM